MYAIGDHVFAKRSVKSDKSKDRVAKIMNGYTGPWEVVGIEHSSSYKLCHVVSGKTGKSHAAHLSPFPVELIPFEPVDGPDNVYGQLYRGLEKDPY